MDRFDLADLGPAILTTKLHIPDPGPRALDRPRLIQTLDRAAPALGPVILVRAPAGFGKTTLLSQWLHSRATPAAWLSLDDGDNDRRSFWAHLVTALDRPLKGGLSPILARFYTDRGPGAEVLTPLINRLHQALDSQNTGLTLVLDDFHRIHAPEILDSLNFFLDHPLPGFTLVLASRTRPPMGLSRLRSQGRLLEIQDRDLAFTPPEIQELTRACRLTTPLDARGLDLISQKTEGWITAVKLALISLEENPGFDLKAFTGRTVHVRDFLLEEVFSSLPAPLARLMTRLAILERFSPALCEVMGEVESPIEEMTRRHLFLIPLDAEGNWYRFHHLFQDFLARHLEQTEDPAHAHARAARWFSDAGLFEEAFHHALAGNCPELAARLLSEQAPALYARGGDETLLPLIRRLPAHLQNREILLLCYHATMRIYNGEFQALAEMEERLTALQAQPQADPGEIQALTAFHRAGEGYHAFYALGEMDRAIDACTQALDLLPPGHNAMAVMLRFLLSLGHRFAGNPAEARRHAMASDENFPLTSALGAMNRISLEWEMGNLNTADKLIQDSLQALEAQFGDLPPALYSLLFIYQGVMAMATNDMETATRAFHRGMALVKHTFFIEFIIIAQAEYALFLAEIRAFETAHDTIDQAIALSAQNDSWLVEYNQSIKQLIHLKAGILPPVEAWAKAHPLPHGAIPFQETYASQAHVHLALAQGRHRDALDLLQRLIQEDETQTRNGRLITCLVLRARALFMGGEDKAARAALSRALELAAPQGYIRIFVVEEDPVFTRTVLELARAFPGKFYHTLKAALAPETDKSVAVYDVPETFNTREIAILEHFARGLSNKETARELSLSVNTIRWYASGIFSKLYVNRRGQAVARALELGLIHSPGASG